MDTEHGFGHILLVINVCCLWQENLNNGESATIKHAHEFYLWKTNFSEGSQVEVNVVRVFEMKPTRFPFPLLSVKNFTFGDNIRGTEMSELGKIDSVS